MDQEHDEDASAHLRAMAERLHGLAQALEQQGDSRPVRLPPSMAQIARGIYAKRRRRDSWFGAVFGEPAWDILLDLFAAEAEGMQVSVSSACIAASVPATTGLRWLKTMEEEGLIVRKRPDNNKRLVLVELTDKARAAMAGYLLDHGTFDNLPPINPRT